jgi:hypothetical protein
MKRSISFYLSQGISDTRWGFKHIPLSQRFMLLVYGLVAFFGKLFFFIRPFFTLAEINLVTLLNERKPFSIWQMFDQVVDREQYNRLMVSYLVMDLFTLFVAGILSLVPVIIWGFINPSMSNNAELVGFYNALIIYFIVLGIMGLLFSFSFYRPFAYVSLHYPNHRSSLILTTTHQLLKNQNKVTVFVLNFVYFIFLYFIGLLITVQGSTVVFGSLIFITRYQGFLISLIFAIVLLVMIFLFVLWILPVSYVLMISIQHHLLIDSLNPAETLAHQPLTSSTSTPDLIPKIVVPPPTPNPTIQPNESPDKNIISKTKRKSR